MTDTDPGYLEEAAAELRKAREANEARSTAAAEMAAMHRPVQAEEIRAEVADRNMEIFEGFARLAEDATRRAAIEAGLPPCGCHETRQEN